MNQTIQASKRDLVDIYKHAIAAVRPENLIKSCVTFDNGKLVVHDPVDLTSAPISYDLTNTRLHVVGGGKCVLGMALGLAKLVEQSNYGKLFSNGCLSIPLNVKSSFDQDPRTRSLLQSIDVTCKFGSRNNLPDDDSVQATREILDLIAVASKDNDKHGYVPLFVVLISGGGSACLTSPRHINLEQKSSLIKELVQRGADIVELNMVRRYFSHVKGGNLARRILSCNANSRVISLIMSDVVGDPIEFIASGPTCLDSNRGVTHEESMRSVMRKYELEVPHIPPEQFSENVDKIDSVANRIIGSNKVAMEAVIERARALGYQVTSLGNDFTGTTDEILGHILDCAQASDFEVGRSLIVCGGESTVVKERSETWGLGGRTQEMALDYMLRKLSNQTSPCDYDSQLVDIFLAGSTDGQDGPTDVAACMASQSEWSLNRSFKLDDALRAKRAHDSNGFWTRYQPDWLIKTGPSGTNVMDVYMLMRVRK